MSFVFKIKVDPVLGEQIAVIGDQGIGWVSPENESYLAWLAEGNTPEPWEAD